MRLGDYLKEKNLINDIQLEQALQVQQSVGGKLGDILLAITSMRAQDYYRSLAGHYKINFIELLKYPIDTYLLFESDKEIYLHKEILPIKKINDILVVATSNPSIETFQFIKDFYGAGTEIVCSTKYDILFVLQNHSKNTYLTDAINKLVVNNYQLSSKYILSTWQRFFFIFLLIFCVYSAIINPIQFFAGLNYFLMFSVTGILLYKMLLSFISFKINYKYKKTAKAPLPDENLPIYSVLIPLFQESKVTLRHLFRNIEKLDYPKHQLDIKILLEQNDVETIQILKELNLPRNYEFVYIPFSTPQTKAKACNYGLQFARGEYLTLYDAEDKPEPLQLKIALQAFLKYKDENLACVQCRLNFYNFNDNWLTTMFTIEYIYWFDLMLPALEYLNTPIPLGGTSNHFKTLVLRNINAWDPYNVAEDADVGIRLSRLGYTSRMIASTTYEEATCRIFSWIKQRTRWIKGYMQTYLVHMHNPYKLWKSLKTSGFIGFHLFIGGTILTNLSNLILWLIFAISLVLPEKINFLFPQNIIFYAQLNFIIGSFLMILLNILGVRRRKKNNYKLILYALTAPVYWLLMSIASYRALYQLLFKPSHWEKTEHGVSKTLN